MGRGGRREAGSLPADGRWRRRRAPWRRQGVGALTRWPLGAGAPGNTAATTRIASHGRWRDSPAFGRRTHGFLLGALVCGWTAAPRRGRARRWRARVLHSERRNRTAR